MYVKRKTVTAITTSSGALGPLDTLFGFDINTANILAAYIDKAGEVGFVFLRGSGYLMCYDVYFAPLASQQVTVTVLYTLA